MRKSASVGLSLLAAIAMGAPAGGDLGPCAAATFSETACQAAIQSRGYCSNGRWVRMKYRQPYPYYYDGYDQFVGNGGVATAVEGGACGPPEGFWFFGRGRFHHAAHGGFGATGSGHSAHG